MLTQEPHTLGDVRKLVGGSLPNISRHLSVLRVAGLIRTKGAAKTARFWIGDSFPQETMDRMLGHMRTQQAESLKALD